MTTEIYYFSGTGNSYYIAKEIHQRIPDSKLIPIAAILNNRLKKEKKKRAGSERRYYEKSTAENVGFIFPCHGLTIPIPVREFLRKLDLESSKYIFSVVTRGGSIFHGFSLMNKILKKQNKKLHASFVIDMGMNDPKLKSFTVPTIDELEKIEMNVQQKLDIIQEIICYQKEYQDDVNGVTFSRFGPLNYVLERLILFAVAVMAPRVKKYFYTDSKCMGCGICEKVCPSQKIIMVNDKPLWQCDVNCFLCYACLNYCPTQAIQIYSKIYMKSFTKQKGRYPHPYARICDIANQKRNIEDLYSF